MVYIAIGIAAAAAFIAVGLTVRRRKCDLCGRDFQPEDISFHLGKWMCRICERDINRKGE